MVTIRSLMQLGPEQVEHEGQGFVQAAEVTSEGFIQGARVGSDCHVWVELSHTMHASLSTSTRTHQR